MYPHSTVMYPHSIVMYPHLQGCLTFPVFTFMVNMLGAEINMVSLLLVTQVCAVDFDDDDDVVQHEN